MKPSLLILAAGIGSRYGSLKQMDEFGPSGETLIDYSVFDAFRAGFHKVTFVISRNMENEFREIFSKRYQDKIEVHYVLQEIEDVPEGIQVSTHRIKPWGTGHAVLVVASKINEPFAVLNGDDFYGAESFKILFSYLSSLDKADKRYCLVGYKLSRTLSEHGYVSRAICELDEEGYLKSIVERTHVLKIQGKIAYQDEEGTMIPIEEDPIVSTNLMGFTPSVFSHLEFYFERFIQKHSQNAKTEFFLPDILNQIIQSHKARVKVLKTEENWFGVTYKEDKTAVTKKIQDLVHQGIYPENLWG
jgi:UTP-glucose-1-phosphate uridylyltransferase